MSSFLGPIISTVVGGLISSGGARSAANAQTAASNRQIESTERMFERTREDLSPYREGGGNALAAILYEMGLGPAPMVGGTVPEIETINGFRGASGQTLPAREAPGWSPFPAPVPEGAGNAFTEYRVGDRTFATIEDAQAYQETLRSGGTQYGGFQATPGYGFAFDEAMRGVNALAGAQGGLDSGATRQALQERATGLANQEYGNYFNRLMGLTGMGQSSAAMQADANANQAMMTNNALANIGNAQAAGAVGQANAFSGLANNLGGLWQYQNMMGAGPKMGAGGFGGLGPLY